jgi:ribonuclease P protein component
VDDSNVVTGIVIPRRHARRAVTRALIKRQVRAALLRHRAALHPGVWIVRMRSGFDTRRFVSAASTPLRTATRDELDQLFMSLA